MSLTRNLKKRAKLIELGKLSALLGEVVSGRIHLSREEADLLLTRISDRAQEEKVTVEVKYKPQDESKLQERLGRSVSSIKAIRGVRLIRSAGREDNVRDLPRHIKEDTQGGQR